VTKHQENVTQKNHELKLYTRENLQFLKELKDPWQKNPNMGKMAWIRELKF
jgi:hypothetical protein